LEQQNKKIKIILADDSSIFREGLKATINCLGYGTVVAEAENGIELLDILEKNEPDIVITDIIMPGLNGIEATRAALSKYPSLKILVLSSFEDEEYLHDLLEAGVKGYGLKDIGLEEFDLAIKLIMKGNIYLAKELQSKIHNFYLSSKGKGIILTSNELAVLKNIKLGYTNKKIGELLFKDKRTIEGYRARLLNKTKTNNSSELIAFAITNKLI
jgi:DNA-binding NarL/FixJ family response regulator